MNLLNDLLTFLREVKKRLIISYEKIYTQSYKIFLKKRAISGRKDFQKSSGNQEIVVSLTTIPERLPYIHLCLESLLYQDLKPSAIILWIDEGVVLTEENKLIIENQLERGVKIKFCKDIGPYKKFYYSFIEFPEKLIVTADDDFMYPRKWLSSLYESHLKNPENVHAHRAHLIKKDNQGKVLPYIQWNWLSRNFTGPSFKLFITSGYGAILDPQKITKEILNINNFIKLCPTADDIWLNAMLYLSKLKSQKVRKKTLFVPGIVEMLHLKRLSLINLDQGANDTQFKNVMDYYDLWSILE